MGWFGKLSIKCSRHAVPQQERDKISFWDTANLLGNYLFAGKQYLAAGWMCCPVLAGRGEWGQHSFLAGMGCSPFPSWPSMGHWREPKCVPHPKRALKPGRGGLEHLLNRRGSNLELVDWIQASHIVLYRVSASISSSLGSFANLGPSAANPTAQKWNILHGLEGQMEHPCGHKGIHFLIVKPKGHAYVQGITEICKLILKPWLFRLINWHYYPLLQIVSNDL